MKCHRCNQDSLKAGQVITKNKSNMSQFVVRCEICGLTIGSGFGENMEKLCELFIYNEQLEAAYKLGGESYFGVDKVNPYSLNSDQIALNKSWGDGWNDEKRSAEFEALSLSSEKLKDLLKDCINKRNGERDKRLKYTIAYRNLLINLRCLSKTSYWLKRTYKDCINNILKVAEKNNPDS